MLDNLLDIEVAYSLLRGGAQDNEHDPIDINYEKLKTKIEVKSLSKLFFGLLFTLFDRLVSKVERRMGVKPPKSRELESNPGRCIRNYSPYLWVACSTSGVIWVPKRLSPKLML